MDFAKAGQIVFLMLSPTLAVGAAIYVPRAVRLVRRRLAARALAKHPRPTHAPIEQLAADLRRLLLQHEALRRSTGVAMRARRLQALEGAITDCAAEAARALEVPYPDWPVHGALTPPQLRRLLHDLAGAGLVLPPTAGLVAGDERQ
jgi:hypothetical protein